MEELKSLGRQEIESQASLKFGKEEHSSSSALSFYSTNYQLEPTVALSEDSSLSTLPFYSIDFFFDNNGELVLGFDEREAYFSSAIGKDESSWQIPSCLKLNGEMTSNDILQQTKVLFSSSSIKSDSTITDHNTTTDVNDSICVKCELELDSNYPSSFSKTTVIDGNDDSSDGIFIQRQVKSVLSGNKLVEIDEIVTDSLLDETSEAFHERNDRSKLKEVLQASTNKDKILSRHEVIHILKNQLPSVKFQTRFRNLSTEYPIVYSRASIFDAANFYNSSASEPSSASAPDDDYGNDDECCSTLSSSVTTVEDKLNSKPSEMIRQLSKHTVITGVAGVGKTTSLIRLYNLCSQRQPTFFSQIPQIKSPCSLKSFFLRIMITNGIALKEAEDIYEWLESHQFECTLFLDGLDEVSWGLSPHFCNVLNKEELSAAEIISNLCHVDNKEKFKKMKVVMAGRPYSVLMLPPKVRPDKVMYLNGLSIEDSKQLFTYFCGGDASIWKNLPREMVRFCKTPFNVQMVALTYQGSNKSQHAFESVMDVFVPVLLQMYRTDGYINNSEQFDLRIELAKLSYLCHHMSLEKETVSFGHNEIIHFNIEKNIINAFCVSKNKTDIRDFCLNDEDSLYQLCHPVMQQSLAALFPLFLSPGDFDRILMTYWPITSHNKRFCTIRRYFLDLMFYTDDISLTELIGPQQNIDLMRRKVQDHIVKIWEHGNSISRGRYFPRLINRGDCVSSLLQRFVRMKVRRKRQTKGSIPYGVDLLLDGAYVGQKAALAILFPSDGFAFSAKRPVHEVETQFKVASFITKMLITLSCEISSSDQYIESSRLLLHILSQLETIITQLTLQVSTLTEITKLVPPICRLVRDGIVTGRLVIGDVDTGNPVDNVKDLWEVEVRAACTMIRDTCRYNNVAVDFFAQWSDLKEGSEESCSISLSSRESSSDPESVSVHDQSTSTAEIPSKTNESSQDYEKILTLLNVIDNEDENNAI